MPSPCHTTVDRTRGGDYTEGREQHEGETTLLSHPFSLQRGERVAIGGCPFACVHRNTHMMSAIPLVSQKAQRILLA
jgi:hypothetical protein